MDHWTAGKRSRAWLRYPCERRRRRHHTRASNPPAHPAELERSPPAAAQPEGSLVGASWERTAAGDADASVSAAGAASAVSSAVAAAASSIHALLTHAFW